MAFAIAINRRGRPVIEQIAKDAGLSSRTFSRIASQLTWASVRVEQVDKFCAACGVDIFRVGQQRKYLKRNNRQFARLTSVQEAVFRRQCAKWLLLRESTASA